MPRRSDDACGPSDEKGGHPLGGPLLVPVPVQACVSPLELRPGLGRRLLLVAEGAGGAVAERRDAVLAVDDALDLQELVGFGAGAGTARRHRLAEARPSEVV